MTLSTVQIYPLEVSDANYTEYTAMAINLQLALHGFPGGKNSAWPGYYKDTEQVLGKTYGMCRQPFAIIANWHDV